MNFLCFCLISIAMCVVTLAAMLTIGGVVFRWTKDAFVAQVAASVVAAIIAICYVQYTIWYSDQETKRIHQKFRVKYRSREVTR